MGKKNHDSNEQKKARQQMAQQGHVPMQTVRTPDNVNGLIKYVHRALNPAYGGLRLCNIIPGVPQMEITVSLDTTGSNIENAKIFYNDFPGLMDWIVASGRMPRPVLQIATINDMLSDPSPSTNVLGQFEADGVTSDQWLRMLPLFSGGGGQGEESYGELLWMLANQNKLEAWNQGRKGILFMLFDEQIRSHVYTSHLARIYNNYDADAGIPAGDPNANVEISVNQQVKTLEAGLVLPTHNIPIEQVIADIKRKYDVYPVIMGHTEYWKHTALYQNWQGHFGAECITEVEDPHDITEAIFTILALRSGVDHSLIRNTIQPSLKDPSRADFFIARLMTPADAYGAIVPVTTKGIVPDSTGKPKQRLGRL